MTEIRTNLPRREFLRLSTAGTLAVTLGGSAALLGACDPGPLNPADSLGLRLHPKFTGRLIATSGVVVPGTGYTWHQNPDGGDCFALPDGGWSYVSNDESFPVGGAGYVRFAADGTVVGAGSILTGTVRNCAGGATPWGTWLSCEEMPNGTVWECDPIGANPAVQRLAMGAFMHEAAACDVPNRVIYLTEDRADSGLYRFVPTVWPQLGAGVLQVLTEVAGVLSWQVVPNPSGVPVACRNQVANTKRFNGGEGAAMSNGRLVFTTKGDNRVWQYDPAANTLKILYDLAVQQGKLSGVDNVVTNSAGVIYVAEDGGDLEIVLVREDGNAFPVVQLVGVAGSELAGPAFSPDGSRLYFSSQRNPGTTYEVKGPWGFFNEQNPPPFRSR